MNNFSKNKFMSFYRGMPNERAASDCYDLLQKAFTDIGVYSDLVMAGALATTRVECGRAFRPVTEYANGIEYDITVNPQKARSVGNVYPGDGVKFKGRGFIQITGRYNYATYGAKLGINLIDNPNLALQPDIAARILAQYFKDRGCVMACNTQNWGRVRLLVNGGTNGLSEFLIVIRQYMN